MTTEDGCFCWSSGSTPLLEGLPGLSSILRIVRLSRRTVWALCCKIDRGRPSTQSKEFLVERFIQHTCQQQQKEWNWLVWPMSPAFSGSSLYSWKNVLIQQAQEQMSMWKIHEVPAGCNSALCFFSSFDLLISYTQQVYLRKPGFQSQMMLHRDMILPILNTSCPKPRRGLVTLPRNKPNASTSWEMWAVL